jgi:hypothetical protein
LENEYLYSNPLRRLARPVKAKMDKLVAEIAIEEPIEDLIEMI